MSIFNELQRKVTEDYRHEKCPGRDSLSDLLHEHNGNYWLLPVVLHEDDTDPRWDLGPKCKHSIEGPIDPRDALKAHMGINTSFTHTSKVVYPVGYSMWIKAQSRKIQRAVNKLENLSPASLANYIPTSSSIKLFRLRSDENGRGDLAYSLNVNFSTETMIPSKGNNCPSDFWRFLQYYLGEFDADILSANAYNIQQINNPSNETKPHISSSYYPLQGPYTFFET